MKSKNPFQGKFQGKYIHVINLILLGIGSIVLSLLFYHPYYFGDELTPFFRTAAGGGLGTIYDNLNSYKPRLLFNAIWAVIGYLGAPRYIPMILNAIFLYSAASLLYFIACKRLGSTRAAAFMIGFTLIISRFGTMLYFDYLSGIIETLSLSLFLLALYYALGFIGANSRKLIHLVWIIALSCLMVWVHERFVVVTFVIGYFLILEAFKKSEHRRKLILAGLTTALLPLLTFFLAGRIFSSMPLFTGTAGRSIRVGSETVHVFLTYLSNTVFATNFGHPWFVGSLSLAVAPGQILIPVMAAVLLFFWVFVALQTRYKEVSWARSIMLLLAVLALISIASLPGPDKQESRWMFPVAGTLGLLIVSLNQRKATTLLLGAYLLVNATYFATGSYADIFNVPASRAASTFGDEYMKLREPAGAGLIIDAPEPQTTWWLGGDSMLSNDPMSGLVFCRANFGVNRACAFPPSAMNENTAKFDYGLKYVRGHAGTGGSFVYLDKSDLAAITRISAAAATGDHSRSLASLTTTPSLIDLCKIPNRRFNVTVRWKVKEPGVTSTKVWLKTGTGAPTLFSEGGTSGEAKTGEWVTSKLAFVLIDVKTKTVLATANVSTKNCK